MIKRFESIDVLRSLWYLKQPSEFPRTEGAFPFVTNIWILWISVGRPLQERGGLLPTDWTSGVTRWCDHQRIPKVFQSQLFQLNVNMSRRENRQTIFQTTDTSKMWSSPLSNFTIRLYYIRTAIRLSKIKKIRFFQQWKFHTVMPIFSLQWILWPDYKKKHTLLQYQNLIKYLG